MTKLTRRPFYDSERQECIYFIKQLQHENAYLKKLICDLQKQLRKKFNK